MTDPRGIANRGTEPRGTPNAGNAGTYLGNQTVNGVDYARYRAEPGTWISASLKQQGYDRLYGKNTAYGAYEGVVRTPDDRPFVAPDKIKPGQEYLIPVAKERQVGRVPQSQLPPSTRDTETKSIPPASTIEGGSGRSGSQAATPYSPPPSIQAELPWPRSDRINDDDRGIGSGARALTRSSKRNASQTQAPEGANIRSGKWKARLLARSEEESAPEEIVAADPKSVGFFADPHISREVREAGVAMNFPNFARWLQFTLTRDVSNFCINLGLPKNDRSTLVAARVIVAGNGDEGTQLQNGSQLNAFRHAFGQALIVRTFGRKFSEIVGFAHEDLPTIDTTQRRFSDPVPSNALFMADTVADQLNNEIGRRIAEELGPNASNREIAAAVLRAFRDGGLYVASFPEPGEVTISRQRLKEGQFEMHTSLLKHLNEEGRVSPTGPDTPP